MIFKHRHIPELPPAVQPVLSSALQTMMASRSILRVGKSAVAKKGQCLQQKGS
jgi:hypothetical protein